MEATHQYFDGHNGMVIGETYEGEIEEIAEAVLEHHQNNYATYNEETKECGPWTKELLIEAIKEALETSEPLYVDPYGDAQSWLVLTES